MLLLLPLPLLLSVCVTLLPWQDTAKGKEDFSCGEYSGDDVQTEAILVRQLCVDICGTKHGRQQCRQGAATCITGGV
jgi:hypothetical protein